MLGHIVHQRLRTLDLKNDIGSGVLAQHFTREQNQKLVTPQYLSPVIDDTQPVRVSIIAHTEIRLFLENARDERFHVFRHGGIGVMVRKRAIEFREQLDHLCTQVTQDAGSKGPRHAIARVNHDLQPAGERPDSFYYVFGIVRKHIHFRECSLPCCVLSRFHNASDFLDFFTINRCVSHSKFEPVELRWIMAPRNHDATIYIQIEQRVVHQWCGNLTNANHIDAGGKDTPTDGLGKRHRTDPHIVPKRYPLVPQRSHVRSKAFAEFLDRDLG